MSIVHEPHSYLSTDAFNNGILRYTQVMIASGLAQPFHGHCVISQLTNRQWSPTAQFVWNKADATPAHITRHPDLRQTREEQPNAVRVSFTDSDRALTIAHSSVYAFQDILLIAAFYIGISEIENTISIYQFTDNDQHNNALQLAATLINLAKHLNANYSSCIEDENWQAWYKHGRQMLVKPNAPLWLASRNLGLCFYPSYSTFSSPVALESVH